MVAGGGNFGVMVEVPLSTDTGTGSHKQEPNEDDNHKDNSGLLLRFSDDDGVTYYNYEDPRNTFPFDRSSPRRKLTNHPGSCHPADGTFSGVSTFPWCNESFSFETCYQLFEERKYCWTKSYRDNCRGVSFKKCIQDGDGWHAIPANWVNPVTKPTLSCGDPCQDLHQDGSSEELTPESF